MTQSRDALRRAVLAGISEGEGDGGGVIVGWETPALLCARHTTIGTANCSKPALRRDLIEAGALAGYGTTQSICAPSRFVPPRWEVECARPCRRCSDLLEKETEPSARAVLGPLACSATSIPIRMERTKGVS